MVSNNQDFKTVTFHVQETFINFTNGPDLQVVLNKFKEIQYNTLVKFPFEQHIK